MQFRDISFTQDASVALASLECCCNRMAKLRFRVHYGRLEHSIPKLESILATYTVPWMSSDDA